MEDYNGGNRPGSKIHIEGVDYLVECTTKKNTEFGTLHFKWPEESAFFNAGWRCYLIGGEKGHLRWVKIGHERVHYTVRGGRFYRDDEIIVDEYNTALRSKDDVYYIFYTAPEAEALKQLAWWQFQFQPLKVLSKYKPLFVGGGLFIAAALLGKIHGRV